MPLLEESLVSLLDDAGSDLLAPWIEQMGISEPGRAQNVHLSSNRTQTLYQQCIRACPGRSNCSRYARYSPSHK